MIPIRLPWRLWARPSATLHEIQVSSEELTCSDIKTDRAVCQEALARKGSACQAPSCASYWKKCPLIPGLLLFEWMQRLPAWCFRGPVHSFAGAEAMHSG